MTTQQMAVGVVGGPSYRLEDQSSLRSQGIFSGDENPLVEQVAHWAGEWVVGTTVAAFVEQSTDVMRVSVTNATTYTAATGTITKVGAFASYVFRDGDQWIASSTDGGFTNGASYPVVSRVSDDAITISGGPGSDGSNVDGSVGVVIDLTNDLITLENHRVVDREPVQFTGSGRPTVSGVAISNAVQFYLKQYDEDRFEVYKDASLTTKVDFDGKGTSWSLKRYLYWYSEEKVAGGNGRELYNTIGAPQDSSTKRYPSNNRYWDHAFTTPPDAMSLGGVLEGCITGVLRQCAEGNKNLYLVLDPDSDVRANGIAGAVQFTASAVAATDIWTKTAHGLFTGDLVQLEADGSATNAGGTSLSANYHVRRIDADTFYLYTDSTLKTRLDVSSDGIAALCRCQRGSDYAVRFAFSVPNTVSTFTTHTQSDATWDLPSLTLTKTGAWTHYIWQSGDQYAPSSTDGSWDPTARYTIASATADTLVLLDDDPNGISAPATDAVGVADGTVHAINYTPFMLRWWFVKDLGQLAVANAIENGIWFAELWIPTTRYQVNAATSTDGIRIFQSAPRTRPQRGVNFNEARKFDWNEHSYLYCYPTGTQTSTALTGTITGASSGATATVINHNLRSQRIMVRNLTGDFEAGEAVSDGSTTVTIGPVEPSSSVHRISTRIACSGLQNGRFEVRAHNYSVTLKRAVPA